MIRHILQGGVIGGVESYLSDRDSRRVESEIPGPLGRDDNNIFSLHEVIAVQDVDLVSFDFFDTLFFRRHLCLSQVMEKSAQYGASLVPGERGEAFHRLYAARGYASGLEKRKMGKRSGGDEPTLDSVLERSLEFLPSDVDRKVLARQLAQLEGAIEARNLEMNPDALSVFRKLQALGRKVCVTSDMYFGADILAKILKMHGLDDHLDYLFVSSDYGVTKASGALYEVVAEKTGIPPHRIVHVGDNWNNDVVKARVMGLRSQHFYNYANEAAQMRMEKHHATTDPATVRRARIRREFRVADNGPLNSLDEVLAQVIAPAAALFIHEILHRAVRKQSSAIYFLTRDGTIFREIAEGMMAALPELYPQTFECRTLATSRSTGSILGFQRNDSDYLYVATEYLTEAKFTFGGFLEVFGIEPAVLEGLSEHTRNAIAHAGGEPDIGTFRHLYWEHADLRGAIVTAAMQTRKLVVDYLDQEGLFEAHNPMLVDIGYSGTWGKQLSPVLEEREMKALPVPETEFAFFATNRYFTGNVRELHPSITMRPGYILDHRDNDALLMSLNYPWLEPFFLDPNLGKLEGFVRRQKIEPVFAAASFGPADKARINGMRQALVGRAVEFADDMLRHEASAEELKREVFDRMRRLIAFPRRREVDAINQLAHQRGMNSVRHQEIALHFYPNNFKAKLGVLLTNDHWIQGSLARSHMGILNHALAWYFARTRSAFEDWKP